MRAPVLLGQQMIEQALRDPAFFSAVPEFLPLQHAATALPKTKGRCGGSADCSKARNATSFVSAFIGTTLMLDRPSAAALCAYFGGAPLLVQGIHPTTHKFTSVKLSPGAHA